MPDTGHANPSDEALLAMHLEGDGTAMRVLVERYHDALLGFLVRMIGDRGKAEDVFQDAFLQVHLAAEKFDPSKRFKPWLFTIASNKARDVLRRSKRRPEMSFNAPVAGRESTGFIDLMSVDLPHPTTAREAEERSERVQRAIDALTENQREILLLAYFQQMTYQQLAALLELPLGTVKSRLHGAVAAFARNLKQIMELQDSGESEAAVKRRLGAS